MAAFGSLVGSAVWAPLRVIPHELFLIVPTTTILALCIVYPNKHEIIEEARAEDEIWGRHRQSALVLLALAVIAVTLDYEWILTLTILLSLGLSLYLIKSSEFIIAEIDEGQALAIEERESLHSDQAGQQQVKIAALERDLQRAVDDRDEQKATITRLTTNESRLRRTVAGQTSLEADRAAADADKIAELRLDKERLAKIAIVGIGQEMATKEAAPLGEAREQAIRASMYKLTGVAVPYGWVKLIDVARDAGLHAGVARYHAVILSQDRQIEFRELEDSDYKWSELIRFTDVGAKQARQDHKENNMSGDTFNFPPGSNPVIITRNQAQNIAANMNIIGAQSDAVDQSALTSAIERLLEEVRELVELQPDAASNPELASSVKELEVAKDPVAIRGIMAKMMGAATVIGTGAQPLLESARMVYDMIRGN